MAIIIDKRFIKSYKSLTDKKRFIDRKREQIKAGLIKSFQNKSITNLDKEKKIAIPISERLDSPQCRPNNFKKVFIGNKKYRKGDTIPKPSESESGNKAGTDEGLFELDLSFEEVVTFMFEDLELPELTKKEDAEEHEEQSTNAGYQKTGLPSNLSIIRSFKNSLGRKIALTQYYNNEEERINEELLRINSFDDLDSKNLTEDLEKQLREVIQLRDSILYLDNVDLRYRHREIEEIPITKGVLFCLMDVSGSMDLERRFIAKIMLYFLYLFVRAKYTSFEVVFVKHAERALVCSEDEFFNAKESGGTSFLSGYKTIKELIETKYFPKNYNIFIAQASDGGDNEYERLECAEELDYFLSFVNLFIFFGCSLTEPVASIVKIIFEGSQICPNLIAVDIQRNSDFLALFRSLFERKT